MRERRNTNSISQNDSTETLTQQNAENVELLGQQIGEQQIQTAIQQNFSETYVTQQTYRSVHKTAKYSLFLRLFGI